MSDSARALLEQLIERPSVTPDDVGCQKLLVEALAPSGFQATHLPFGDVDNLWLAHGSGKPCLVLLGHTDVVPAGDEDTWQSPPFKPICRGDYLYGRGAADMKGSLAAMVVALRRFVAKHPEHKGSVALLVTSDEEGDAQDGIRRALPALAQQGINVDYCLVGEPSSLKTLGDNIRIGRRGSLNAWLTVHGQQGHAAYPELAHNPIHAVAAALNALCAEHWDDGNKDFPPTSMQVSNVNAGVGATNVIPGQLQLTFNFRYSPASTEAGLKQRVEDILRTHGLTPGEDCDLRWQLSGAPFHTPSGRLLDAVNESIDEHCGGPPRRDTGGGTSDGRFVAPTGAEVVEVGPVNASIHKVDECIRVADIDKLIDIYQGVIERVLMDD